MQLIALSVSLVDQRLACDDRGVLVFIAHAHPKRFRHTGSKTV